MQVTFLVLAHRQPEQLAALADLLVHHGDRVVVHVDAKVDAVPFHAATRALGPAVRFTSRRHEVRWGGFGVVAATTTALSEAVSDAPGDYYALLSGADLPIKPLPALHAELASGAVYMNSWPMPAEERGKPMSRLERWHYAPRDRDSRAASRLNRHVLARLPRRDVARGLGGARPYGGSQWWLLPHGCAEDVLGFVDRSPRFVRFFRHATVPDEMFFQTVLHALPGEREVRPHLTHTDWSRSPGRLSPAVLTVDDLPALAASPKFFARKFDPDVDVEVCERVRRELVGAPARPRG
ncbi:beta-1,6-N-acetylglucosaminyltransferase [Kineococcus sp. SYSU DK004]|uniref:beta-1,6-N-acetylglucosaminyltransferase n=1 Tax=Kineococcus sp. SYSU DK004 TaxID=3383125 RepID=UPI003D7D5DB7